jgi:glycosyltransferase involved in cell wall biosynthesis
MTKAKQFANAAAAIESGRFHKAQSILFSMDLNVHEPHAKALKDRMLQIIARQAKTVPAGHALNMPDAVYAKVVTRPQQLPSGRPLPRISIVTPSYNQGEYIAETVQSVLAQGYPHVEHIVIDGGSTDNTMAVLERFRDGLAYLISEKDKGQSHALNKGFARATGDIFCWLNSDDQLAPGALYAVALAFDSDAPDMVAGICEVYRDGKLQGRHLTACRDGLLPIEDLLDLDNGWNSGQFFYQPEVFFSRSLWERAGAMVREDYYYSMDYELWCRFALAGAQLKVIGTPLAHFRSHPAQKTAVAERFKAELRTVREKFVAEHQLSLAPRNEKAIDWSRRPRVALVNDIGGQHGAGIAHVRIGAALETAECEVEFFELRRFVHNNECDIEALLDALMAFSPDTVVFGNVHGTGPASLAAVTAVCKAYPAAWVSHDFWLVTGRCAYFGECDKYLSACDSACPTASEYPVLPVQQIGAAHLTKRTLMRASHRPAMWANSAWAQSILARAQAACGGATQVLPSVVRLGVPTDYFGQLSHAKARTGLDIPKDDFVVLFSATSLSDPRKGVDTLLDAFRRIDKRCMHLLILGNSDIDLKAIGHKVSYLGYVTDPRLLATAYAAADVFVGPSKEETFGQVFIEAALSGTPSIAFDQSGMVDAVKQGTSGLRVPSDAQTLARCIEQLADDLTLRQSMGFWAPVWARSVHSLEASYRTLHHGLEDMGVLQELALPRRITLMGSLRVSRYHMSSANDCVFTSGFSAPEGPFFPDFPEAFRWGIAPVSQFRLFIKRTGRIRVAIDLMNPLFAQQQITVEICGVLVKTISLARTAPGQSRTHVIETTALAGWQSMSLKASQFLEPNAQETRRLAFVVVNVRLTEIE